MEKIPVLISLTLAVFGFLGGLYAFFSKKESKDVEHSKDILNINTNLEKLIKRFDVLANNLGSYEKKTEQLHQRLIFCEKQIENMQAHQHDLIQKNISNQEKLLTVLQKNN